MKKTLSLVLVLCMVFSFFGFAGAAFKDDADIQYKEAVGVMTGIGAINGMGDNTFAPKGELTRAQAAKLVAYAVLGADVAKMLPVQASSFTDVDANFAWAIPSIEYLASKGVINGRGDGTFDPNGKVTAFELAKMMLVAAGYGVKGEYTGNSWALNVAIDARNAGIFNNTKAADLSKPATREEAALYAFNGIQVNKVVWDKNKDSYTDANGTNTLADVYGAKVAVGMITSKATTGTNVAVATVSDDTGMITAFADAATYAFDSNASMVGHLVKIYYKDAKTVYSATEIGTVVNVAKAITTTTAYKAAFGTVATVNNPHYEVAANLAATKTDNTTVAGFNGTSTAAVGTYVVFGGKVVSYIAPVTYVISAVADYKAPTEKANGLVKIVGFTADGVAGTTANIVLNKLGSDTPDKVALYDGIKKGDFVYVTVVSGAKTVVEKATAVLGVMTSRNATSATIGGTTYARSAMSVAAPFTTIDNITMDGKTNMLFVLDKTGAVYGYNADYTPASLANTYGVVMTMDYTLGEAPSLNNGFKTVKGTASVLLLLADGSKAIYSYELPAVYGTKGDAAAAFTSAVTGIAVGEVVKFAVDNKVFTELTVVTTTDGTAIAKSPVVAGVSNGYLTADSAILYWNHEDVTFSATAVKGYANAIAKTATVKTVVDNGVIVFAYVDTAASSVLTNYAYIRGNTYDTVKYDETLKTNLYGYTAYIDGVPTVLWAKNASTVSINSVLGGESVNDIFSYTLTDGLLTEVAKTTEATVKSHAVTYCDGTTAVLNGVPYTYANAKVITVSNDTPAVVALGTLTKTEEGYTVYYMLSADGKALTYVYVMQNPA